MQHSICSVTKKLVFEARCTGLLPQSWTKHLTIKETTHYIVKNECKLKRVKNEYKLVMVYHSSLSWVSYLTLARHSLEQAPLPGPIPSAKAAVGISSKILKVFQCHRWYYGPSGETDFDGGDLGVESSLSGSLAPVDSGVGVNADVDDDGNGCGAGNTVTADAAFCVLG